MYEAYIQKAVKTGAAHAKAFTIDQIVFDPRTILKCMWGCEDFGRLHTCPSAPKSLKIEEYIRVFRHYKSGIIVHCHDKTPCQKISYELERQAFLDGFYFAFSLSDCSICAECKGLTGQPCAAPKRARPAFHSVGIDVFATVKALGLPLYPLKSEGEEQNWYSAVFIE
ncbi:MAG: DUF2284 domain-containing protein [Firmicutes bacterium]|nr:DUF2284 domain-containing protein [Bacillota bacterium]